MTGTGKVATWGTLPISPGRISSSSPVATRTVSRPILCSSIRTDQITSLETSTTTSTCSRGHPHRTPVIRWEYYAGNRRAAIDADLGAYGNTAATLPTVGQRIQLIEPGTFQKVEVGQPVDVRWITAGLTNPAPVLLMNAGGSSLYDTGSGRWSAEAYRRGFSQVGSFTQSVDVSGVTNPPPVSVLQSFSQANGSTGESMRYDIPLADGNYQIRLFFVDPTATAANQRRFNVTLQGQTVLANYDIFADAGATRKAVAKTFNLTASQGSGLSLELVNITGGFNAHSHH